VLFQIYYHLKTHNLHYQLVGREDHFTKTTLHYLWLFIFPLTQASVLPFFVRSEWNFILTLCHGNSYVLHVHVNNSLKIFLSENIITRKLIFCRELHWVVLSKICLYGSKIPNIFRTGSEKPRKLAKSLKIFFSRTASATGEQKTVLLSLRGPYSSLFKATSCDRYFSDYASESAKVWKIKISMFNNFFNIGLESSMFTSDFRDLGIWILAFEF
jgi:hypothetical protein